jgi:small nuclear ribonucleoprotein (snRNP)-like protein
MSSSSIAKLQTLLCQPIRISTTDNRILVGTFAGTDKPLNIILTNAEEYRSFSLSFSLTLCLIVAAVELTALNKFHKVDM